MGVEIDHIYICTGKNAPQGDLLTQFGLTEGSSNVHPGQGTANRRFFFRNVMLELLWVENPEEVRSETTSPMRLYERCMKPSHRVSPFGIGFRPTVERGEDAPFPSWDYRPAYLPDSLRIQVARDISLEEPMYFYLFFAARPDAYLGERREPLQHKMPLKEVTSVRVHINRTEKFSETADIIGKLPGLALLPSGENLLEVEFDGGTGNRIRDFRPDLPLIFRW